MSTSLAELAADRPLHTLSEDTLGRAAFARRIAAEILAWNASPPLVITLTAEPGSGKTTLKNFIAEALAAGAPGSAIAVELEAWRTSPGDAIGATLGAEIAERLEEQRARPELGELAAAWREVSAAQPRSAAAGCSPRTAHERLRRELARLAAPLVVFLDDADDLGPGMAEGSFPRWLKGQAGLPHVVWFLILSRPAGESLEPAVRPDRGPAGLRPLVHLELELPEAPERVLRQDVEQRLLRILEDATFPDRSRERWNDVFATALWPLFSTPRDVKRFVAGFALQFAAHFEPGQRVLEVNAIDLVVLEALRFFAPAVYLELRYTFRRRETRLVRLMSGRDEERREARLEIDEVVARLAMSPRHKRAVAAALQHLLPPGVGGVHGGREDWDRDLRLCGPRHSQRYFDLGAASEYVPASRLIEIARSTGDRAGLESLLTRAAAENVLPEVLDRLPPLLGAVPESHLVATASAFTRLCDRVPAGAPEDVEARLVRLACEFFARLENPRQRETVVADLLEDETHLTGPVLLLHQLRPRSDLPAGSGASALSVEQFRRLVQPAVDRLHASATDGSIWRSREYGTLIRRWWEWSPAKEPIRQWLLDEGKDPERARAWLRTFLGPSPTAQPREKVLQLDELGQFCDPKPLVISALKPGGDALDRATAQSLAQALSPRATSPGFALRSVLVRLEAAA